jgi:hypothetical protein
MKKLLPKVSALAMALMLLAPTSASAQSPYANPSTDTSTLPQVPGCSWFWDSSVATPGVWRIFCGSDEIGWYTPYDWYFLTGIWPGDYGLSGE